jgi:hypothetical protein
MTADRSIPMQGRRGATPRSQSVGLILRVFAVVLAAVAVAPEMVAAEPARAGNDAEALARQEADLLRRYRDLERSFLRLADLLATTDPRRAAVLRGAFERAREEEVGDRLGTIVTLLEEGQLLKAGASQEAAVEQFRGLLDLLEEGGRDRNLADTKREVRQFLGRVSRLIARQRDLEGSTESGADTEQLAGRQQQTADEASELAGDLGRFAKRIDDAPSGRDQGKQQGDEQQGGEQQGGEQQGGEQQGGEQQGGKEQEPSSEDEPITGDDDVSRAKRTRRLLQAAERRMREARERLDEARRSEAREEQQRAVEELETARAELEEILRQMREEEIERLLVQLETRVRLMLKAERGILASAGKLATAEALGRRELQLEAARIGREQDEVTAEASRAITLVRDDGSAVAIPEALGLLHDDSREAARRLARGDVTEATLGLVGELVTGLEELLAALEKSRREEDRQQQAGQGGGRPAKPDERPLVDQLAELKMLRSLQVRVKARTERFARLLDEGAERAAEPELVEALGRLADRQRAIEQAARDIVAGRIER